MDGNRSVPGVSPSNSRYKDVDNCIEAIRSGHLLTEAQIRFVCEKLIEILLKEPNIRNVHAPVTVVGDVHGQYYDVLELFKIGGDVPSTNYLFLGDYVDRGHFSLETISLLACLKLRYPERVTLLRGNHESRQTTMAYGFYAECMSRYKNADAWKCFTDMFDYLPLCALIDNRIFALHGGLSPSLHTLDQIRILDRFHEVPFKGPICDLMWGDPDPTSFGFRQSTRGAGYTFGKDIVDTFVYLNGLSMILRSHQLCHEGYQVLFDNKFATVWSAPNYCYRMKNLASILEIGSASESHPLFFNECPVGVKQQKGLLPPQVSSTDIELQFAARSVPSSTSTQSTPRHSPSSSLGSLTQNALGALSALHALNAMNQFNMSAALPRSASLDAITNHNASNVNTNSVTSPFSPSHQQSPRVLAFSQEKESSHPPFSPVSSDRSFGLTASTDDELSASSEDVQ